MIEKKYVFTLSETKTIERIIEDDHVGINHMVLAKSEALPEHHSNSNVYLIIIRGQITLRLDDQTGHIYPAGSILSIPFKTKMNISNDSEEILEFFVVKAPSPRNMPN
ncbi:MAG: cupin domain-containing protein [Christensenellales bacterium]|jgi:quercetin dioxygenase-like cupin family protein